MSTTSATTRTSLTVAAERVEPRRVEPRRAPALRLTRRGRVTAFVVAVLILLVAAVAVGSSVVATSGAGEPLEVDTVTVQPGQTLWEIAADSGIPGDPRDVVHDIEVLNHLDGAELQIGQSLDVPVAP